MRNIGNGIQSAISGVENAGENLVNGVTDNNNMNNDNMRNNDNKTDNKHIRYNKGTGSDNNGGNNGAATTTRTNNNSNYSAMRTATNTGTTDNLFGLSNLAWTWIVMIIAAACNSFSYLLLWFTI